VKKKYINSTSHRVLVWFHSSSLYPTTLKIGKNNGLQSKLYKNMLDRCQKHPAFKTFDKYKFLEKLKSNIESFVSIQTSGGHTLYNSSISIIAIFGYPKQRNLVLSKFTYHSTWVRDAGFATYSQLRRTISLVLVIISDGLTLTTGGSVLNERNILFTKQTL